MQSKYLRYMILLRMKPQSEQHKKNYSSNSKQDLAIINGLYLWLYIKFILNLFLIYFYTSNIYEMNDMLKNKNK